MTTTLLLSAYNVVERQVILSKLEKSELSSLASRDQNYGEHKLIDHIANNETICSQTEITIQNHGTL